jgi:hypothetical protein
MLRTKSELRYAFQSILWGGILSLALTTGCQPLDGDEWQLQEASAAASFSYTFASGDSNRVVVTDKTQGAFNRLWSAPGGQPDKITKLSDTLFFPKAGNYVLTLYTSMNGGGTASAKATISIRQDAKTGCSDLVALLVGSCEKGSRKCWTLSKAANAVGVGPTPGSLEWYKSPLNGLQAEQYDDGFCFDVAGGFVYENNGLTVDPWNGYVPVPYAPPKNQTWFLDPKGGLEGLPRLTITEGAFLGVWDASNVYDIVSIKSNEMVVRTPFLKGGGWFQLTFTAK